MTNVVQMPRSPDCAGGHFTLQFDIEQGGRTTISCLDVPDHLNNKTLKDVMRLVGILVDNNGGWGPPDPDAR